MNVEKVTNVSALNMWKLSGNRGITMPQAVSFKGTDEDIKSALECQSVIGKAETELSGLKGGKIVQLQRIQSEANTGLKLAMALKKMGNLYLEDSEDIKNEMLSEIRKNMNKESSDMRTENGENVYEDYDSKRHVRRKAVYTTEGNNISLEKIELKSKKENTSRLIRLNSYNAIKEIYPHIEGDIEKNDFKCNYGLIYTDGELCQVYEGYTQKPDGAYDCEEFLTYKDGELKSITKGCHGDSDGRFNDEKEYLYEDGNLVKYSEGIRKVSDVIWEKGKEIIFENGELKSQGEGYIRLLGGFWETK